MSEVELSRSRPTHRQLRHLLPRRRDSSDYSNVFREFAGTQGLYFCLNEIHYHNSDAVFLHSSRMLTEGDKKLEPYHKLSPLEEKGQRIHHSETIIGSSIHGIFMPRGQTDTISHRCPLCKHSLWEPISSDPLYPWPVDGRMAGSQAHLITPSLSYISWHSGAAALQPPDAGRTYPCPSTATQAPGIVGAGRDDYSPIKIYRPTLRQH